MIKKIFTLLVLGFLLCIAVPMLAFASNSESKTVYMMQEVNVSDLGAVPGPDIILNERKISTVESGAVMINDTVYVPIDFFNRFPETRAWEAVGDTGTSDPAIGLIINWRTNRVITFNKYVHEGQEKNFFLADGKTYVPLSYEAEFLGFNVKYDALDQNIVIE